jgi:hypothetical protein
MILEIVTVDIAGLAGFIRFYFPGRFKWREAGTAVAFAIPNR